MTGPARFAIIRDGFPVRRKKLKQGLKFRLKSSKQVNPKLVRALFREAGWDEDIAHYTTSRIEKLLRHSRQVLTAWDDEKLVAFASTVSDGVLCAMVQNLVVHPKCRNYGLGTRLLREIARANKRDGSSCLYVLGRRSPGARTFFGRIGFKPLDGWQVLVRLSR
ncbi:MAG: GNAT family N-acetyltransferase [Terriglobia bacterium]